MGANQSKAPLLNQKLVIESLRALELNAADKDDFVHVDSMNEKKSVRAPWKNLSVSEVEGWEHELLQDPKNRYVEGTQSTQRGPISRSFLIHGTQTCIIRSLFRRSQDGFAVERHADQRPADLQCQDPFRRRADYEPAIFWPLLAFCIYECFQGCIDEETSFG